MRRRSQCASTALAAALLATAGACGGSPHTQAPSTAATRPSTTPAAAPTGSAPAKPGPGALQAEANAAAAGDIPDNQVFLRFNDPGAGYSLVYPEGWAQQSSGGRVTFRDKNNIVRVVIRPGAAPSSDSLRRELRSTAGATIVSAPTRIVLGGRPAFKVVYSTESAPNQVTGKRVKLIVDRYYLWRHGRTAIVDLGTPVGVDNVDAYRMMIESFRWS
jgi:hypothetical protein